MKLNESFRSAEESDTENTQRIKSEYQRFLYKTYGDVKELNKKAKEKKAHFKTIIAINQSFSSFQRKTEHRNNIKL